MAKITFIDPVKSVSGKLSKASIVTFMRRQAATSNAAMLANPNYPHTLWARGLYTYCHGTVGAAE